MMNILKFYSDLYSICRSNIKAFLINIVNCGGYSCHPFVRMHSHVKIVVDSNSKVCICKGTLIEPYSKISATNGGQLTLGSMVGVNRNSMIICHDRVIIGDNTIMGPGVCIYDHDHLFDSAEGVRRNEYISSPVTIGRNCWIGAGVIILRGTSIGDNCLIGAGCVVKGEYPKGSIIIQRREEVIKCK